MDADHIHALVQRALDEFDERPLDVSARRAYRIARLRAEVAVAHRLYMDLRPLGGSDADRISALSSLYPELTYDAVRKRHAQALEGWMQTRRPADLSSAGDEARSVLAGSIAELEQYRKDNERAIEQLEADENWSLLADAYTNLRSRHEVTERIRAYIFDFLVRVESQLEASDAVAAALDRHRSAVDIVLDRVAPDIRDQLQAALRTAREEGGEYRSQVLTTCRRVLTAVADHLFPASNEEFESGDGKTRAVGQQQYRNRILAAIETSSTMGGAFSSSINELAVRLDRLDELTQKGVHADVSDAEMEFGLAQTYFLAGELLRTHGNLLTA